MRVARVYGVQDKKTAQKRNPWAKALYKVDGVWVCYESAEEGLSNHGPMRDILKDSLYTAGAFSWPRAIHTPRKTEPAYRNEKSLDRMVKFLS